VKPNINLVDIHAQLSNNGHPMDGALVGARSLWPCYRSFKNLYYNYPKIDELMILQIMSGWC